MKLTKEELITKVREQGGETPDDFTISLLEDISDSFDDSVVETLTEEKNKLEADLVALKKAYADRFTLSDDDKTEDDKVEEVDTYDSIFD